MEPAVFVPSQNRSQTNNETSGGNAQEEQTLATSKGERNQAVLIESSEPLTRRVLKKLLLSKSVEKTSINILYAKRLSPF